MKPRVFEQICEAHPEWMKLWARLGNEAERREAIAQKADDFEFEFEFFRDQPQGIA
jgi:hypothetical protein